VHTVALTWAQAALLAGLLLGLGMSLRVHARTARLAPFAVESAFIAGLYALWQLVGSLALDASGAYQRAAWIVRVERDSHLPSEVRVQHLISGHPLLTELCNIYYATMHFAALFALLLWLFIWHRARYPSVRATVILLTAACLVIQFVPVAPPRLLHSYGFVDTAQEYGQSVYAAFGSGADQLSAMPSVHVGWAMLVAFAAVTISRSRWRWLVTLHPLLTIFVVAATANHFWLDGIVAIALLWLAIAAQRASRTLRTTLTVRLATSRTPSRAGIVTAASALAVCDPAEH
jgi:PAP2 superfamily